MPLPNFFSTAGAVPVKGSRRVALTANGTVVLPAGVMLRRIYIRNVTANAVTGGIRIGTAGAGTQVVTAQAVAASAVVSVLPTIENYQAAAQTLYIEAVTSWNSASLEVIVTYDEITTRTQPTSNTIPA